MESTDFSISCKYALIGDELELKNNVTIVIRNGKITDIEDGTDGKEFLDCIVLPSFINAHTHVGDSFIKDIGFFSSLKQLVAPPSGLKFKALQSTPRDKIAEAIKWAIQEMRVNGIHSFLDFRENSVDGSLLAKKANDCFQPASPQLFLVRPEKNLGDIKRITEYVRNNSHAVGFNISSPTGWTDELLSEMAEICFKERTLLFGTHVAETKNNPLKSMNRYGTSDAARILRIFGEIKDRLILVHCNYLGDDDIIKIIENGSSVVICPRTASIFGNLDKAARIYRTFLEHNVTCALGTDNVMINSPDLFQEMNFFTRFLKSNFPDWRFEPREILKMVTINAARVLKIDNQYGSLAPGKVASFILIDLSEPAFRGIQDPLLALILRAHPGLVSKHYINGIEVKK
ncbi:MAG: amidohydrolase family protein [Promethearchaeota archaeon]